MQYNVDRLATCYGDLLRLHTHKRNTQRLGISRDIANCKLAINIGYDTHLSPYYQYRCAYDRLSVLIGSYNSRYSGRLSQCKVYSHKEANQPQH